MLAKSLAKSIKIRAKAEIKTVITTAIEDFFKKCSNSFSLCGFSKIPKNLVMLSASQEKTSN